MEGRAPSRYVEPGLKFAWVDSVLYFFMRFFNLLTFFIFFLIVFVDGWK